ncbi:MAG: ComEC/Rec2 family competence protein [Cyanobacteria bacterium J06621_11]
MRPWGTLVIVTAYLLGLLLTGITEARFLGWVSLAGTGLLAAGAISGALVPRFWRLGPTRRQWWIAGLVGLLAASYCIGKTPTPANDDVSLFASNQEWRVTGEVMQMPQTNRQGKGTFFLASQSIRGAGNLSSIEAPRKVSGKLYVTAPLEPSKQLYPGELVELKGEIYRTDESSRAGQSGFGDYLSRQGCFSGFRTRWVEFLPNQTPPQWALWKLRARIVTAQDRWLGAPAGNLLSAMTLGRKAVDLPYEVRDSFIAAGLAHTLAASGFHVTLMLALVLRGLKYQPPKTQAIAGWIALVIYVGLTGLQPSVIRASLMGAGTLLGLATQRQVKPLGGLLMAATLILIWNPQWIWDVGFQLSVVATLGLILTVRRLMGRLEWMPTTIATLIAVPVAAYLWTIPLQLLYFQVLPTYSVMLNAIATPLVVMISIGGFISAIAAIILPVVGSAIAANLYYPIHLLIWLVDRFNQFPGSSVEILGVKGWHVVLCYCVYAAICLYLWKTEKPAGEKENLPFLL